MRRIQPIKGFETYVITDDGRIWSYKTSKWLKMTIFNNGYRFCSLMRDNKANVFSVHRLVAENFIPNPENKRCVNHIDNNKLNNNVKNLEWATHKENIQHAWKNGYCQAILDTNKINLKKAQEKTKKRIECIETGLIFESAVAASKYLGCLDKHAVSNSIYLKGKCKGFTWRYL